MRGEGTDIKEYSPANSIPKEKSWKGREHLKKKKIKVGRVSEARCLSCLVRWKHARTICLTVKRESNPPTKLVRVALGPKKELPYFV